MENKRALLLSDKALSASMKAALDRLPELSGSKVRVVRRSVRLAAGRDAAADYESNWRAIVGTYIRAAFVFGFDAVLLDHRCPAALEMAHMFPCPVHLALRGPTGRFIRWSGNLLRDELPRIPASAYPTQAAGAPSGEPVALIIGEAHEKE